MNRIVRNIPNSITCLNILFGTMAIIFAAYGDRIVAGVAAYRLSWLFIALAAVADFCDGFAARLLKAYSEMGKELDSLCDNVSFGVAPAALICFSLHDCGAPDWLCWMPMLIPVATALRLAKFNLDTRQTTSFLGLPVPANALFWIGYSSALYDGAYGVAKPFVVIAVILLMAALMLSELPLLSLKFKSFGWRGNTGRWILIAGVLAIVGCLGISGLIWIIPLYVVVSVLNTRLK